MLIYFMEEGRSIGGGNRLVFNRLSKGQFTNKVISDH